MVCINVREIPDEKVKQEYPGYNTTKEIFAALDEAFLPIKQVTKDTKVYDREHAYEYDGYFYLFRGKGSSTMVPALAPGIYYDPTFKSYFIVMWDRGSEKAKDYEVTPEHLAKANPLDIAMELQKHEKEIYSMAQAKSSKVYVPEISLKDAMLKRAIKEALIAKAIDIDALHDRFRNKNEQFNFKAVVKNDDQSMTMLIFERAAEALNLKYTMMIEDSDPSDVIGEPLSTPIVVSSSDTFSMSAEQASKA